MKRVNLEDWLRGEAIIYGIEQIIWATPKNKSNDWQEDQITRLREALDNWDKSLKQVISASGGSGYIIAGTNVDSNGVYATTRLCGGLKVHVTWGEIKHYLETVFSSEAIGGQVSFFDLMGSGFRKEAQ